MLAADFSGYWRLAKTENLDVFLKDLGLPWVVRKVCLYPSSALKIPLLFFTSPFDGFPCPVLQAAVKFAGSAVDVINHSGTVMRVTSLNAKGSWTRSYDTETEIAQRNAEGAMCKTTSWWEGEMFFFVPRNSQLKLQEFCNM